MQTISDRNQRTLKLVPRMVVQHIVNKWTAWEEARHSSQDEGSSGSGRSASAPPEDQLPLCQEIGNYLNHSLNRRANVDAARDGLDFRR